MAAVCSKACLCLVNPSAPRGVIIPAVRPGPAEGNRQVCNALSVVHCAPVRRPHMELCKFSDNLLICQREGEEGCCKISRCSLC